MFVDNPDRRLLNSKFEGYKLDPLDESAHVYRHTLEHRPKRSPISGQVPLSFHEVESRIRQNQLAVSPVGDRFAYIDSDLQIILVHFEELRPPTFSVIGKLTRPEATNNAAGTPQEYPSASFLDENVFLATDGDGLLFCFQTSSPVDGSTWVLHGVYTLPPESGTSGPFRIHSAVRLDESTGLIVLSRSVKLSSDDQRSNRARQSSVVFDVLAAHFELKDTATGVKDWPPSILEVVWTKRGQDSPLYVAFDGTQGAFLFVGAEPYCEIRQERSPPSQSAEEHELASELSISDRPPPYAWTQDDEEVTIALPLPASTLKKSISVVFSTHNLSLKVVDAPEHVLSCSAARLWADIAPSSSFWTWDSAGTSRYGLLTLHIEKLHPKTRWLAVFDSSANITEVPETLDPSSLVDIREALEKFTSSAAGSGEAGESMSSSLSGGEHDDEVDGAVGSAAVMTWVNARDGLTPASSAEDSDGTFKVLTTPLPGRCTGKGMSLVAKHTIDGLLFTREDGNPTWMHTATYHALAFVLASKREVRFLHHAPGRGVLAFESGNGKYGGNVYVYRDSPPKANWAKQAILRIDDGAAGLLLGVCSVSVNETFAIVCLCERELVVLRDVL